MDELPRPGRRSAPKRGGIDAPPAVLRLHHSDDLVEAVPYLIGFQPRDSVVLVGIEGGPGDIAETGGRVRITVRMDIADLCEPPVSMMRTVSDTADDRPAAGGLPRGEWPPGDSPGGGSRDSESRDGNPRDGNPRDGNPRDGNSSGDGLPGGGLPGGDPRGSDCDMASAMDDGAGRAAMAILRSGATAVVGVVFVDSDPGAARADEAANRAGRACKAEGLELGDLVLVVAPGLTGARPVAADRATSRVAAEATYAGLVALDDRHDLVDLLTPEPAPQRARHRAALDAEERLVSSVAPEGRRRRRSAIRALFAATRTLAVIDDQHLVRFGAALSTTEVRDACWLAVEGGRVDGEDLWRELGRRLPAPYDAAPLFLFGWQRWRDGDGVLAGIAARRALDSDAAYNAANLLHLAVTDGLDPFRTPRLRKGA